MIDAGFISKLSKYLGNGKYLKYNIFKLSKNISKKSNLYCRQIFYYTAPPFQGTNPDKNESKRKEKYDKFISKFKDSKSITIKEGRVQKIKENGKIIYKQKGVDTHLVMDLMKIPLDYPKIKKVILIACDSDFVPTIEELKKHKVKIILYSYLEKKRKSTFSTSNELTNVVFENKTLTKKDFEESTLNEED